jgi:ATP-binding cassette subfamily F protein uup
VSSVIYAEGNGIWQEYAGGYSDMQVQRAASRASAPPATPSTTPKAGTPKNTAARTNTPKRKLSFKEKHALETLPAAMTKLEKTIAALKETLSDPKLFTRDPKKFQASIDALEQAETDLAAQEEQWLELEMLREELENS